MAGASEVTMATAPAEAAEATTFDAWIEQDPHRPGRHQARFLETGTHLWVVLGALRRLHGDIVATDRDWHLSEGAVRAAVRYELRHQALFDAWFVIEEETDRCGTEQCVG